MRPELVAIFSQADQGGADVTIAPAVEPINMRTDDLAETGAVGSACQCDFGHTVIHTFI